MDELLYMGVNGSVLIIAVICFRHFFSQQVSRRLIVFLWICVIVRLLLPVSIPVSRPASGWMGALEVSKLWQTGSSDGICQEKTASAGLDRSADMTWITQETGTTSALAGTEAAQQETGTTAVQQETGTQAALQETEMASAVTEASAMAVLIISAVSAVCTVWTVPAETIVQVVSRTLAEYGWLRKGLFVIWLLAAVFLALRILVMHMRSSRVYRMSLPVCDSMADKWLDGHRSMRRVSIRKSEFIKSPLTYGVIRPVILLPSEIELDEEESACIMEHEWIHIKRWDILMKYILYLTICVYWFNPFVWVMAVLFNRDLEMACDEEVIRSYAGSSKASYALILIRLAEERQKSIWPVEACFARQSELEERIRSIMKIKKYSKKAAALAAGLICCTILSFTVSAQETAEKVNGSSESTRQAASDRSFDDAPAEQEKASVKEVNNSFKEDEHNRSETEAETEKTVGTDTNTNTVRIDQPSDFTMADGVTEKESGTAEAVHKQIVELAGKYVGAPYQFGGTDLSSGVDSIGFVKAVYALAGFDIPADLDKLSVCGDPVSLEELTAGDIIIYSSEDKSSYAHAAVYDGSGRVIHASNMRDGVKVSDLNYRDIAVAVRVVK